MQGKTLKKVKNLALGGMIMYKMSDKNQIEIDFGLPFYGRLDPNNRWIELAKEIPWDEFEHEYAEHFTHKTGSPAKNFRIALGALLIQKKLGTTDRETVKQIMENPYLQYFLGYQDYVITQPFDPSMMVHFRMKISEETVSKINEEIFLKKNEIAEEGVTNKGTVIVDATCAPQDIRYPNDASLLNEARIKLEVMIAILVAYLVEIGVHKKMPRTYKNQAYKFFLGFTKGKNRNKTIRKVLKKLLSYVERDIRYIDVILEELGQHSLEKAGLSHKQIEELGTIRKLAKQQSEMLVEKKHHVDNRIVSISQPYVRPIVRNKSRSKTEFGAKINIAIINGYATIDTLSWDSFNEGTTLIDTIERYYNKYGYYPEVVLADNIYKTKANKAFCKEHSIRFTGNKTNKEPILKENEKKSYIQDSKDRQVIEGLFGTGKRRYSLNLIMTKRQDTSETSIALEILALNLGKLLRTKIA